QPAEVSRLARRGQEVEDRPVVTGGRRVAAGLGHGVRGEHGRVVVVREEIGEAAGLLVFRQQRFDAPTQGEVVAAGRVEVGRAVGAGRCVDRGQEHVFDRVRVEQHGEVLAKGSLYHATAAGQKVSRKRKNYCPSSASA